MGHFLSATKDFGINDPDSNFVRYINRWRLEKSDSQAKLSPPKKQIIWYVEDTVPLEYRPYVEDGISEWNKAFEKIGFKNAIAVRWQESGRDDFDPEDTNYCTFRWITSDVSYAMSCLRANPMTGEMIDGDVVFDASFIRYWKDSYALLIGSTTTAAGEHQATPLAFGEVISPILASKMGFGQPGGRSLLGIGALDKTPGQLVAGSRPGRPELPPVAARQEPRPGQPRLLPVPDRLPARFRPGRHRPGRCAQARDPQDRQGQGQGQDREEARAQARASRGVHRPGHQAHRDARGRPLAGPAAQLQGQHDADGRPAPRHDHHPVEGAGRQRHGLQPDQHRPQGEEAGRLLLDHDRPL